MAPSTWITQGASLPCCFYERGGHYHPRRPPAPPQCPCRATATAAVALLVRRCCRNSGHCDPQRPPVLQCLCRAVLGSKRGGHCVGADTSEASLSRRRSLFSAVGTLALTLALAETPALAETLTRNLAETQNQGETLALAGTQSETQTLAGMGDGEGKPDMTITDRVYLDITRCPTTFRADRTLGDAAESCSDGELLGRIVIGLYGRQVPQTVANFKAMCTGSAGSSYLGSMIHRIVQGQYLQAGKQGSREKGEVPSPSNLQRNEETVTARAFMLHHSKPGTVSLCLSVNDDEDGIKLKPDYRNVEFLITTGPGPAPQLDNNNIVFGTVLEGMDVVTALAASQVYKPNERIRQFNDFAQFIGDERASNARNVWYRPLKSLYISDCGLA